MRVDRASRTVALTVAVGFVVEVAVKIEGIAVDSAEQREVVGVGSQ